MRVAYLNKGQVARKKVIAMTPENAVEPFLKVVRNNIMANNKGTKIISIRQVKIS